MENGVWYFRGSVREPGSGFFNQGLWQTVKQYSVKWMVVSMGAVGLELEGTAAWLGTMIASYFKYPERGSETDRRV
jgi:hypothetical protein